MGSMRQPRTFSEEIVPVSAADSSPLGAPDGGTSAPRPEDADDTKSPEVIALEEVAELQPARRRALVRAAPSRTRAAAPNLLRALRHVAARLAARVRLHPLRLLSAVAGLALGFAAPLLLARMGLTSGLDAALRALDLDDERVQLIDQLLLTLTGALIAAAATRRRLASLVGAALSAVLLYVIPFVGQAQQPPPAVAGVTQVLVPGALAHVITTIAALCILAAAIGAAIGFTVSDLTLGPVLALSRGLWVRLRLPNAPIAPAPLVRAGLSLALGALFVVLASAVGDAGSLLADGLSSSLYAIGPSATSLSASTTPTVREVPHSQVLQGTYPSPALGGALRAYYIYLPPAYSTAITKRYPTFYLLHGSPGDPHQWMSSSVGSASAIEDALLTESKMREAMLVSPDGNGPVYRSSLWANTFDGRQRMEDAIAFDLVRYIDAHYRTLADPADRAIGGNSDGGYGAINLALHHPEVFGAAASAGGYFEMELGKPGFVGVGSGSAAYQLYNSPSRYVQTPDGAKAAHVLRLVICVATKDGFYQDGVNFYHILLRANITAQLVTLPGSHVWSVWRSEMAIAFQAFDPSDGAAPTPNPTPARSANT
jgi:enterochelin esterase-like enzyme